MKKLACLMLVCSLCYLPSYGKALTKEKWEYAFIKALNYEEKGEFEKAILELERAHQEKPQELLILRELAYCYGNQGNLEKAADLYRKVLAVDAKDENALKNLEIIESFKKK